MKTLNGLRVLVVDDDAGLRSLVEVILRAEACAVVTARDGVEAMELILRGEPIDLLVTDLQMPRLKGRELGRLARFARPDVQVIYMSGSPEAFTEAGGVSPFLAKPFSISALVDIVRDTVSARGAAA